jgi:hypothetical protein
MRADACVAVLRRELTHIRVRSLASSRVVFASARLRGRVFPAEGSVSRRRAS